MTQRNFTFAITSADPNGSPYLKEVIDSIYLHGGPEPQILVIGGEEPYNYRCTHILFNEQARKGWITRKKNLLTALADHPEVVYLHDYVALKPGWYEGWERWGSDYFACMNPIVNFNGERFRDWCLYITACTHLLTKDGEGMLLPYDVTAKAISPLMYFSGSYWVAKKSVMEEYPLDERLVWAEGEDIEWSQRLTKKYYFSMNPFSGVRILKPGKDRVFHECEGDLLNKVVALENSYAPANQQGTTEHMLYRDIIEASKSSSVPYVVANPGESVPSLRMERHQFPWSIKETEFSVIMNTIINNGLTRGYEVATAFGISALAAGLGFKETNGKLVTMDAYIEENSASSGSYQGQFNLKYPDSSGYQSIKNLIARHGLAATVFPEVGWSPVDTLTCLGRHMDVTSEKLDYVFIDAGHWDSALMDDLRSVLSLINKEKYVLFLHDLHCFSSGCLDDVSRMLGGSVVHVESCRLPQGFNLAYVSSGLTVPVQ